METFDELVLAVDADAALKILGKHASWNERRVLGDVKVCTLIRDIPHGKPSTTGSNTTAPGARLHVKKAR
ncbi:hypothetical protein FIBSPDRAFT_860184 [Athelia psychrophila]|uniref:Uncharacterized protein n=1 Tax=Athelia psychrophila TaxID=1759441 RepID=A0A166KDJ4_9AGAM|nr:hypothetical protein FIBSPDRAFT_860184 [Fibularhizoctonia sp. CBS 109695]